MAAAESGVQRYSSLGVWACTAQSKGLGGKAGSIYIHYCTAQSKGLGGKAGSMNH